MEADKSHKELSGGWDPGQPGVYLEVPVLRPEMWGADDVSPGLVASRLGLRTQKESRRTSQESPWLCTG